MFARYGGKGILLSRVQRNLGKPLLRVAVGANLRETRFVGYQHGGVGLHGVVAVSLCGHISTTIFGVVLGINKGVDGSSGGECQELALGFDIIKYDDG